MNIFLKIDRNAIDMLIKSMTTSSFRDFISRFLVNCRIFFFLVLLNLFSFDAQSAEIGEQTGRVVTVLNDGGTPGVGSGTLKSTAVLPVCELAEIDNEALRFAIFDGLGEFYIAEASDSETPPQRYKSQRFLLSDELLEAHDDSQNQVKLRGGKFHSMEIALVAKASAARRKISLKFTTTLFSGTSNDVRMHKAASGAYDGRFFHGKFAENTLEALKSENCKVE